MMCNKYNFRIHSVQEIIFNKNVKIDLPVKTDIKVKHRRLDLVVKRKKKDYKYCQFKT